MADIITKRVDTITMTSHTIRKEPHPDTQRKTLEHFRAYTRDLRGKNLACWCKLGQPCHADVLLKLANGN